MTENLADRLEVIIGTTSAGSPTELSDRRPNEIEDQGYPKYFPALLAVLNFYVLSEKYEVQKFLIAGDFTDSRWTDSRENQSTKDHLISILPNQSEISELTAGLVKNAELVPGQREKDKIVNLVENFINEPATQLIILCSEEQVLANRLRLLKLLGKKPLEKGKKIVVKGVPREVKSENWKVWWKNSSGAKIIKALTE
jgi:hypothetical protein